MIHVDKGKYFTVEEFRVRCGFSNSQRIYKAIHEGRIDGVVKLSRGYLIPMGAVIKDKRIKNGKYVGVSAKIRENTINKT